MAKRLIQSIVLVVCSITFAYFGAAFILDKMWKEQEKIDSTDDILHSLQSIINIQTAILIAEATDKNDKERIYMFACQLLRMDIEKIDRNFYSNPDQNEELELLLLKAEKLKQRLEDENQCYN